MKNKSATRIASKCVAKPAVERIRDLPTSILLTKENLGEISLDLTNSDSTNRATSKEIPAID